MKISIFKKKVRFISINTNSSKINEQVYKENELIKKETKLVNKENELINKETESVNKENETVNKENKSIYKINEPKSIYKENITFRNKENEREKIVDRHRPNNIYDNSYQYFSCFISFVKLESKYSIELIEHYKTLGIEKFYLADDNSYGVEKLSDVLKNYINEGIVEIEEIGGKNLNKYDYYEYAYEKYRAICKWSFYFDFDEFLQFKDKNMTLKSYLSQEIFDKCDVIKIDYLMFYDNDLVYYDKRTLKERFPNPDINSFENNNHKSIVRGKDFKGLLWSENTGSHQPNESLVNMCDSEGNLSNVRHGFLSPPNYKYCLLRHYSMKTAEEFANKLLKLSNKPEKFFNLNESLDRFFKYNKFTEEKLAVFEKVLKTNFPKYHKNLRN